MGQFNRYIYLLSYPDNHGRDHRKKGEDKIGSGRVYQTNGSGPALDKRYTTLFTNQDLRVSKLNADVRLTNKMLLIP